MQLIIILNINWSDVQSKTQRYSINNDVKKRESVKIWNQRMFGKNLNNKSLF